MSVPSVYNSRSLRALSILSRTPVRCKFPLIRKQLPHVNIAACSNSDADVAIIENGLYYSIGFYVRSIFALCLVGMFFYTAVSTSLSVGFGDVEILITAAFALTVLVVAWHTCQAASSRRVILSRKSCIVQYRLAGVPYRKRATKTAQCRLTLHYGEMIGSDQPLRLCLLNTDHGCMLVSACHLADPALPESRLTELLGEPIKGANLVTYRYPNPAVWWP